MSATTHPADNSPHGPRLTLCAPLDPVSDFVNKALLADAANIISESRRHILRRVDAESVRPVISQRGSNRLYERNSRRPQVAGRNKPECSVICSPVARRLPSTDGSSAAKKLGSSFCCRKHSNNPTPAAPSSGERTTLETQAVDEDESHVKEYSIDNSTNISNVTQGVKRVAARTVNSSTGRGPVRVLPLGTLRSLQKEIMARSTRLARQGAMISELSARRGAERRQAASSWRAVNYSTAADCTPRPGRKTSRRRDALQETVKVAAKSYLGPITMRDRNVQGRLKEWSRGNTIELERIGTKARGRADEDAEKCTIQ